MVDIAAERPGIGSAEYNSWWGKEAKNTGGLFVDDLNDNGEGLGYDGLCVCNELCTRCEACMQLSCIGLDDRFDCCVDIICLSRLCVRCCKKSNSTGRPTPVVMQLFSVIMIVIGALITITGRGLLSIIQGVFGLTLTEETCWRCPKESKLGVLFGVEGLTGFTTSNVVIIRRFTVLLMLYLSATIIIGVFNVLTIDQYCREAGDTTRCEQQAQFNAWGVLAGGSLSVMVFLLASRRWVRRFNEREEAIRMKQLGIVSPHSNLARKGTDTRPDPLLRIKAKENGYVIRDTRSLGYRVNAGLPIPRAMTRAGSFAGGGKSRNGGRGMIGSETPEMSSESRSKQNRVSLRMRRQILLRRTIGRGQQPPGSGSPTRNSSPKRLSATSAVSAKMNYTHVTRDTKKRTQPKSRMTASSNVLRDLESSELPSLQRVPSVVAFGRDREGKPFKMSSGTKVLMLTSPQRGGRAEKINALGVDTDRKIEMTHRLWRPPAL